MAKTTPTMRRAAAKAEAAESAVAEKAQAALDAVADAPSLPVVRRPNGAHRSKLPVVLQFPLAVTLSFAMASLGYSLLGEVTKGELASVSRSQDTWGEVGVLAAWRV